VVIIRQIKFNEWIRPLHLSAQILSHTPQPAKTLLLLKLPISLFILKIYNSETIYVAEKDNEIIGICIAQTLDDTLIIEGTAIHPDHRRRGISHKLKTAVQEKAKQLRAKRAITKIEPTNKVALKMAQTQGYYPLEESNLYEKKL
jgi:GNAT superfamily N-acetyltransferase